MQRDLAPSAALKRMLITHAIQSSEFRHVLNEALIEIRTEAAKAANEATVEGAFERVLYGVLRDVGFSFHPEKELAVRTRRHTHRGRTDSRYGALVIEYKQPSTLNTEGDRKAALSQLEEYASSLSEDLENEVVGFLTDGLQIAEVRSLAGDISASTPLNQLDHRELDRLVRSIVAMEGTALTSENLIRDFCGDADTGLIFDVARQLYRVLSDSSTEKTEMLFAEWQALFRLAHEEQSQQTRIELRRLALGRLLHLDINSTREEYGALFSLHTAYAITLKLIAYRVVSDVRFGRPMQEFKSLEDASSDVLRGRCADLEDGELFRQIGMLNLLEGDFFSWYSDANQWNAEIAEKVRAIIRILARYEDVKNVFDSTQSVELFRSLYEATVPQVVRGSFGEFYTPFWLAEHVLDSSEPVGDWNVLDPCCGSGTFLIAAIARLRCEMDSLSPAERARRILERVCGIDLNPLAVLTARIHYFIHIADLLSEVGDDVVIPVFLGDASNAPVVQTIAGEEFITYQLTTLQSPLSISIPKPMAADYRRFAKTLYEFEKRVRSQRYEDARAYLLDSPDDLPHSDTVKDQLGTLADQIIDLERKEWDGIWARIIGNFVATASIGPFSNVVGNPPWIDWKSLPEGYRETVKDYSIDRGLFSGAGRTGGINLNVCALITHVAAMNWLSDRGTLAFLMPRELAYQASYEGWRSSVGGKSAHLVEFHDWSYIGHPFDPVKENFMTFILRRSVDAPKYIPVPTFRRVKKRDQPSKWADLTEANTRMIVENLVAGLRCPPKTGPGIMRVFRGTTPRGGPHA